MSLGVSKNQNHVILDTAAKSALSLITQFSKAIISLTHSFVQPYDTPEQ